MGADLGGTNLAEADLAFANLAGARLVRARLVRADLKRANLMGARLGGANLKGANLEEAMYNHKTRWPKDFIPEGAINVDKDDESTQSTTSSETVEPNTIDNAVQSDTNLSPAKDAPLQSTVE